MSMSFHPLRRLVATGAAALLLGASAAYAACLDQVRELAQSQRLDADPPKAMPGSGDVTSRDLAESGGVIQPPPTSDRSVIAPPVPSADRMPTLPDVTPRAESAGPAASRETAQGQAVERASLQALLIAARSQAERGEEAQCLERLDKARQLLDRKK